MNIFTTYETVSISWCWIGRNSTGEFRPLTHKQLELEETISILKFQYKIKSKSIKKPNLLNLIHKNTWMSMVRKKGYFSLVKQAPSTDLSEPLKSSLPGWQKKKERRVKNSKVSEN